MERGRGCATLMRACEVTSEKGDLGDMNICSNLYWGVSLLHWRPLSLPSITCLEISLQNHRTAGHF